MAEYHRCERCNRDIDEYDHRIHGCWIGRHYAELCIDCLQVVETAVWGRVRTVISHESISRSLIDWLKSLIGI